MKNQKGFTLIELLVVIVIIGILAAVIFVALDPAKRFGQARDARRWSEVVSILNAILKNQVDNGGTLLASVAGMTAGNYYIIGTNGLTGCDTGCTAHVTQAACVDLTGLVDQYIAAVPTDPQSGTAAKTLYYISRTANNRISVGSCIPEQTASIEVKR